MTRPYPKHVGNGVSGVPSGGPGSPILVTLVGRLTLVSDQQAPNAISSIRVTLSGMLTSTNEVPANASLPSHVMVLGMLTLVNQMQSLKSEPSTMYVQLLGTERYPVASGHVPPQASVMVKLFMHPCAGTVGTVYWAMAGTATTLSLVTSHSGAHGWVAWASAPHPR